MLLIVAFSGSIAGAILELIIISYLIRAGTICF